VTVDVEPGSVLLAYVHGEDIKHSWQLSKESLLQWDASHEGRLMRGGYMAMRFGTGGIVQARNDVALQFLLGHGESRTRAEWLFWVDTDMGFYPDTVDRLVESADPETRPVMGGLCFVSKEVAMDGMNGFRIQPVPTLYRWVSLTDEIHGFQPWYDYPRDQVVPIDGTGSACILIHRSALQQVFDEYGTFYSRIPNKGTGQLLSEDLSLCARLGALGIPIHANTAVKTTHCKPQWLQEADYDAARELAEYRRQQERATV